MKSFLGNGLRKWILVGAGVCVVACAGYLGLRKVLWPKYKDWRAARFNAVARKYMAAGDYDNALLAVRNNLRDNQRFLDTWELAADIAKAKNSPDSIYYTDHLAKARKSLDLNLEVIRLALHFGYLHYALTAIADVGPAGRDNAEFHALAAEAYRKVGKPIDAKYQLISLIQLRPNDGAAQLDLAEIELEQSHFQADALLRDNIAKLAAQPALQIRATSLLLWDAIHRHARDEAVLRADQLGAMPSLGTKERILILQGLSVGAPDRAIAYEDTLENDLAGDPAGVASLITYYRETGEFGRAAAWYKRIPEKSRSNVDAERAMADVMIADRDWPGLVRLLSNADWATMDFERQADRAYEARETGQLSNFVSDWKLAVIEAGASAQNSVDLLQRITGWGWRDERYDLLWKLFALDPRDEAVRRPLIAWERIKGDTSGLNQIFARILEIEPLNRDNQNNYAFTSMLLDANLRQSYEMAASDLAAQPKNPYFKSTEALAIFKQGKPADALAMMDSLSPSEASMPERLLYRAIFSAASGDASGAQALIEGLQPARFLPEERDLMAKASATVARIEAGKIGDKEAAENNRNENLSGGWLELVPQLLPKAEASMAQANELYAKHDYAGLDRVLRESSWAGENHIRLALLAYSERGVGDEVGARETWLASLSEAGFGIAQMQDLATLATHWKWQKERFEALDRIFEHQPEDEQMFGELRDYYRNSGRTQDLVRILDAYVTYHPSDDRAMGDFSYYSMLCGINLARAYVAAKNGYDLAPENADRRLIYAFSLWKQKRANEAWQVLQGNSASVDSVVPQQLLRGAILVDMGRRSDAIVQLQEYKPQNPLPEESHLASSLRRELTDGSSLSLVETARKSRSG
jgi:cellulose synthase operon protein C